MTWENASTISHHVAIIRKRDLKGDIMYLILIYIYLYIGIYYRYLCSMWTDAKGVIEAIHGHTE